MQITDDKKHIPILCYVNGRQSTLTLEEAYTLFWIVPFAWLLPLDWFRSGLRQGYMRKLVHKAVKVFAYNLFTRSFLPLRIDSECMLDEHGYSPSRNCFQSRACKLAKIFEGKSPYAFDDCIRISGKLQPAYRMIPGQEWLIVVGVKPESEFTDHDIDWTVFQTHPNQQGKSATSREKSKCLANGKKQSNRSNL